MGIGKIKMLIEFVVIKPAIKFVIGQHIFDGSYDFEIGEIRPCNGIERMKEYSSCPCDRCPMRLAYISNKSGMGYCSQYKAWELIK